LKLLSILKITIWVVVFEGIGFILGLMTKQTMSPWYENLNKSALTPPAIVFPIAWSLIYAILAVVGFLLWKERYNEKLKPVLFLFIVQMIMNWFWTFIFFRWHYLGFSFLWIVILTCLVLACIYLSVAKKKEVALLLIPYFVWLVFAAYLNGVIWYKN
jgi:tryptophan-rich sensory protein